jgi:ABC-type antimicrobial peptide transport system permease subunit
VPSFDSHARLRARLAATVMRSLVWGVSTTDPMTFALAAVVVLAVTIAATLVPALRIVRLNPISARRRT